MSQPEHELQSRILLALGALPNVRIFRNNSASGWAGKLVSKNPDGSVTIAHARPLHAGLIKGSGDLIGWKVTREINVETGAPVLTAQFLSIEVKTSTGRPTPEQLNWRDRIILSGGIAGIVRSVEEALALVK